MRGSASAGRSSSAAAVAASHASAPARPSAPPSLSASTCVCSRRVIDDDEPVGEQQERVGQLGLVGGGRAAVGLQLVAEIADEAAVEVERQLGALGVQARELAAEVVQQRLVVARRVVPARVTVSCEPPTR